MADSVSAFSAETKMLIYRRSNGRCDRCGLPVERMHFHHRLPRGAGGSTRPELGFPSNGLLLHPSCHDWIESKRKIARELGFLVDRTQMPRDVPVYLWRGWVRLGDAGTAILLPKQSLPAVDTDALGDVDDVGDVDPGVASESGGTS